MNEATRLHREAMDLSQRAGLERDHARSLDLLRQALDRERRAAGLVSREMEPTRSVLYRSAAALALECKLFLDARQLAGAGLAGNPPAAIAAELLDILQQIHFASTLESRNVVLDPYEVRVALVGNAIGTGIARAELFLQRAADLDKVLFRTAERRAGRPWRTQGRRRQDLAEAVETFVSAPQSGSFAVTFRLGYQGPGTQMEVPGTSVAEGVIRELFDCLQLFTDQRIEALRQRIPDENYYVNFFGLAKRISPDGDAVRAVEFTAGGEGDEQRRVVLETPREALPAVPPAPGPIPLPELGRPVTLRGTLRLGDALRRDPPEIGIVGQNGKQKLVQVPPGLIDDVVKDYWGREVIVRAHKAGRKIVLEDIIGADEEGAA